MIAWVSRNVICKDKEVMSVIYLCLVRPTLSIVFSVCAQLGNWELIFKSIKKIPRKLTRLIILSDGARLKLYIYSSM